MTSQTCDILYNIPLQKSDVNSDKHKVASEIDTQLRKDSESIMSSENNIKRIEIELAFLRAELSYLQKTHTQHPHHHYRHTEDPHQMKIASLGWY